MRIGLLALLFCVACSQTDGDPTGDGTGGNGDGSGGGTVGSGGSTSPSAPKILSLSTNIKTVHETDTLTISAVVTDPDGIGDVIGGQLMTSDGDSAYGAFATDAGEGAYSMTLSWGGINTTESIDTMVGAPASRSFRAKFFDAEGNSTYRDITVGLQCSNTTLAACDGRCGSIAYTTEQCGECGHSCPAVGNNDVQCLQQNNTGLCLMAKIVPQRVACTTQCAAPYPHCLAADAAYGSEYVNVACNAVPEAMNNNVAFVDLECICGE